MFDVLKSEILLHQEVVIYDLLRSDKYQYIGVSSLKGLAFARPSRALIIPTVMAAVNICYFTVTLQVTFFFPEIIVIVAFPFFFAFNFPLLLTVTTLVLEDLKLNLSVVFTGFTVTFS